MVVNQPVIRKVINFLKFAILTNNGALTAKNIVIPFIVGITGNLFLSLLAFLPFLDFSGEELKFSHSSISTHHNQAIDPGHFSFNKHGHTQPPSFRGGGGLKSNGPLFGLFQSQRLV